MSQAFDVVVIGAGPGGYVAAIKAAQLGLKTALVEARGALGGTCLNVGCIPSKTLLHISHAFEESAHTFADFGVNVGKPTLDLEKTHAYKNSVISGLNGGIAMLLKKNNVAYFQGRGSFSDAHTVQVALNAGGTESLTARNVIIATGSKPAALRGVPFDGERIISSDEGIHLKQVPARLAVIGGGVIGLELGSVWRRFGSNVTVIEYADDILGAADGEVKKEARKLFEKQGLTFRTATAVTKAVNTGKAVTLTLAPREGGKEETLEADVVLAAAGRVPNTEGLNLAAAGLTADERGRIPVDGHLRTKVPHIYAIGDVTFGPMLAHKAEEDGVAAAEIIAGQHGHVDYDLVPSVVYTSPEIASVGKTEEQLKAAGVDYRKGKFPFAANSRARAIGETSGFVKVLACAKTDQILGVHIVGAQAGTIIGEAAVAMAFKAASEDIARICHSHPDLNEAFKEAAMATYGKAIHAG